MELIERMSADCHKVYKFSFTNGMSIHKKYENKLFQIKSKCCNLFSKNVDSYCFTALDTYNEEIK